VIATDFARIIFSPLRPSVEAAIRHVSEGAGKIPGREDRGRCASASRLGQAANRFRLGDTCHEPIAAVAANFSPAFHCPQGGSKNAEASTSIRIRVRWFVRAHRPHSPPIMLMVG